MKEPTLRGSKDLIDGTVDNRGKKGRGGLWERSDSHWDVCPCRGSGGLGFSGSCLQGGHQPARLLLTRALQLCHLCPLH